MLSVSDQLLEDAFLGLLVYITSKVWITVFATLFVLNVKILLQAKEQWIKNASVLNIPICIIMMRPHFQLRFSSPETIGRSRTRSLFYVHGIKKCEKNK